MAKETVYNNTLVSGAADETLTYTRYVKDESSGKSTKELLDEKVNKTDQLGTTQIADKSVTTEKLENESVTTDKLDAASVTTEKVADANITTSKLADSSVETEKINNKAVTTDKLNDGAVDNSKLSPNAVTSEKIKDESIITEKLNDRAVTTEKVEEKAITNAKLGDQSVDGRVVREASLESKHFSNESVTTEKVARKSITKDKLADNAVDASQVVDGSIDNAKLSPDSVTTEKIKDGSVTNEKIADNTLGIGKLDPELRKTIQAATGLPEDLTQMIQDIGQSVKQLHEKDTDLQSQIDDKQQQITANDEDISLLQTLSTQMEETIKSIAATGGASQATAVTYNNDKSKLTAVNIQSAVDEVVDKVSIKDESGENQDTPFRVIENEEFLKAIVDSEGKVLFGFYRATGKPYYPLNDMYHISQSEEFLWVILDAANHPLLGIQQDGTCWAAKAQWLDDIKAIKEALSSIDETLKTFQPKEDGKGLMNLDVADSFFYISNDEYIIAVVDAENRILAGIKYDAQPYFPNNEMYSVIANEEWLYAIIDAENKVLGGFRADDGHMVVGGIDISTFITNAIIDIADIKERTSHLSTIVNDEYLAVETDLDGKVIGYTSPDGSHYLYKVKSETIPTEFEHIEDPEGRTEITADAEGKVMSYRDSSGKKHEHDMEITNIDVSNLNLKGNSVNNIQDALKANGFDVKTPIDWSDYLSNDGDNPLYIPEPRYAIINISGIDSMPSAKGVNEKAYFEMWDMQGNYFKKKVIMNAQGNTTMYFPKKSFACDFFDNEWNGDSFAIKIGDWVPQDSFHFKAQYTDFFKGISIVAYKLIQEVWTSRSPIYSNPWKKALLSTINITSGSWNNNGVNDLSIQKDTGAKCIPDAFPCAVYLNGTFYGVFNWALKKHRDNYHLNKSLATNIHLDGGAYPMSSPLDWSKFEVRNPKGLITKSNETYDGDSPSELIDSTMEGYDASNKKYILSSKVKASIIAFNSYGRTLNSMTKENGGDEFLNEHFDLDNLIDFFVSQYVLADEDIENNWQWVTYDGIKWFVCDYDKDRTFGQTYNCPGVMDASKMINPNKVSNDNYPFKYLYNYHKDDIKKRYNELKSLGIFTPEHVISLVVNWFNRIPAADLRMEYKKWPESPSNRDDNVDREHWKIKEISYGYNSSYKEYDNSKTYQIGELCIYGKQQKALFECVKETAVNPPITKFYTNIPYDLGYHDSIWRVIKYITERFKNIENELNNI